MDELLLLVNNDVGVPHPVGSGLAELTSVGIAPRGKNQILMKSEVHSVAYAPPWLSLKPLPKGMFELSVIEQPSLDYFSVGWSKNERTHAAPFAPQSVRCKSPLKSVLEASLLKPGLVWRVIWQDKEA